MDEPEDLEKMMAEFDAKEMEAMINGAIVYRKMYVSYRAAGFERGEALELLGHTLVAQNAMNQEAERREGKKG